MKKLVINFIIPVLACIFISVVNGQNTTTFTFTGINDSSYFQLESINVKNLTQDCDTVLYYPDTVLTIYNVGIKEDNVSNDGYGMMQNYPNPCTDQTSIILHVPQKEMVSITIIDAAGRKIMVSDRLLDKGQHTFLFTPPGEGLYLFNAKWAGTSNTIRILAAGVRNKGSLFLEYSGFAPAETPLKSAFVSQDFLFSPGDELMLIGNGDELESGFLDSPDTDQNYVFQFATNIPCHGLDSLNHDGQWYHTIQVFSQCWIVENMNAGTMIQSAQAQTDNGVVEKYCMGDDPFYCSILGGLYFWNEMMKYTTVSEGQGICPDGFHVPTDLEWQILEGAVDSAYMIGGPEWKVNGWRGFDAGGNLKQTGFDLWEYPNTGATDAYGFSAIPAGYFVQGGFWGPGYKTYIWSSNYYGKYYRNLDWNQAKIQRNTGGSETAFSVRCIRN